MRRRPMLRRARDVPIRRKLTLVVMTIVGVALLIACALFMVYEQLASRETLLDEMSTSARILGENSAAALSFGDEASARQTLNALRSYDDVVEAAIFDRDGRVFAVYRRDAGASAAPRLAPDGRRFGDDALVVYDPIMLAGERAGTVYVKADLAEIRERLRRSGLIVLCVMAAAWIVALLLSSRLVLLISGPISHLAGVVRRVAHDKNYTIRAAKRSNDELGALIDGFNEMLGQIQSRDEALQEARDQLEARIEARTKTLQREIAERREIEGTLRTERESLKALLENIHAVPWEMDPHTGACSYVGPQIERLWGWQPEAFAADGFFAGCVHQDDRAAFGEAMARLPDAGNLEVEFRLRCSNGSYASVRSLLSHGGGASPGRSSVRGISIDVTSQRKLEEELQQAQKLESVGRLAAGIAHEINTPVQYVNDNCHFVQEGLTDLAIVLRRYRESLSAVAAGGTAAEAAQQAMQACETEADIDYLLGNMPGAVGSALEGLQRVAAIVRSMKEFAHPDRKDMVHADLNRAIESTLTVARNEYKYVADVKTEFGDLPPVPCYLGELNQAVLNIIVNAAHAIEDAVKGSNRRGLITVRTACDGDAVSISIADTGTGIPEHVRSQIFDPFFTTKGVGKGTGQGLAIARSVVVDKHRGSLSVETQTGQGTTFTIRLPVHSGTSAVA